MNQHHTKVKEKKIEYRTSSADLVTGGGLLAVTSLSPSVSSSV